MINWFITLHAKIKETAEKQEMLNSAKPLTSFDV